MSNQNERSCNESCCCSASDAPPQREVHSHCVQCGAEAHGWDPDTHSWWCSRCSAAKDHEKLAKWFSDNLNHEIKESGLADNVIRLLSEKRDDVPVLPVIENDHARFNIVCSMKLRWVPHFLAALKYIQHLGAVGGSRNVTLYADGDGDFHPKFSWSAELPSEAKPIKDLDGHRTYDAG
jgi:hypothetical protein